MQISDLLMTTQRNKASDLHISAGKPPSLRLNGDIIKIEGARDLSAEEAKNLLYAVMNENQRTQLEKEWEVDFAISINEESRFRVNIFTTNEGLAAVFRVIPTKILSLDDLGSPDIFKDISMLHKGLVLVTGPTGSGKSTTLAAMLDYINTTHKKHIITIEDPIEFVHKSKMSIVNHREVGRHTKSFARALKSALREDPDVILVGELRDLETIHLAMTAAETGHLVMGTLHTSSAPKTVDRIIDVFPANEKEMIRSMLSSSIEAVISQRLLKKKDGTGRVAVHEIMVGTTSIRNLIRENRIPQMSSMIQIGSKNGMVLMKDSIYKLVNEGVISREEAMGIVGEEVKDNDGGKKVGGGF
jgi:twitching motility protein PilT